MSFLKSLCCHLKTDINSVTNVKFKFKSIILTLNSIFSKDLFLTSLLLLKDSKFNNIFIRPHLSDDKLLFKKLAYHAQITGKLENNKCVFNRITNTYEIRTITLKNGKSKIDWNVSPYIPNEETLDLWKISFDNYILSLSTTNSPVSNQSHIITPSADSTI